MIERHTLGLLAGKLALVLHLPPGPGPFPCVVACHGLGASKDSDKYLLLGAELPRASLALARFDFRGCGESSGVEAETTVATRIEDARAVLAFLGRHERLDGRVGLLGGGHGRQALGRCEISGAGAARPSRVTYCNEQHGG